jgi:cytochrome b involved in lipid metabolism
MGGRGGYFYVCGGVPFFQGLMDTLHRELTRFGGNATALIADAFSERRFSIEVFGSAKRLLPSGRLHTNHRKEDRSGGDDGVPIVWQSALCTHNAASDDHLWFAMEGSVYDVHAFVDTHPGGRRIVTDVSGLDATRAFKLVSHDVNNEVMGRMASYHVGTLLEVSADAVAKVDVAAPCAEEAAAALPELMETTRKVVYAWVELENCFVNDLSSIGATGAAAAEGTSGRASLTGELSHFFVGASMETIQPYIAFCGRVLQLLEPAGLATHVCESAERIRHLACKTIGARPPAARLREWSGSQDLAAVIDYVELTRDISFALEGTTTVAEKLRLQASLDTGAIHENLKTIATTALKTIAAIKEALLAALEGLENILAEGTAKEKGEAHPIPQQLGGSVFQWKRTGTQRSDDSLRSDAGPLASSRSNSGVSVSGSRRTSAAPTLVLPSRRSFVSSNLSEHSANTQRIKEDASEERAAARARCVEQLQPSVALPGVLDRIIGRGFSSTLAAVVDPVHEKPPPGEAPRFATLVGLRSLKIKHVSGSACAGDDLLQVELQKIRTWMLLGNMQAAISVSLIAKRWRRITAERAAGLRPTSPKLKGTVRKNHGFARVVEEMSEPRPRGA